MYDQDSYATTLAEVHRAAALIREDWFRLQRAFLRADGIFMIVISLLPLLSSTVPRSFANPPYGLTWWLDVFVLGFGIVVVGFTGALQSWTVRRRARRGKIPLVGFGPDGPSLDHSARVFGEMQKEWDGLRILLAVSILLIAVAILNTGSFLLSTTVLIPSIESVWGSAGWVSAVVAVIVASALVLAYWAGVMWFRLRELWPVVRTVESRFGELEWNFWHRF